MKQSFKLIKQFSYIALFSSFLFLSSNYRAIANSANPLINQPKVTLKVTNYSIPIKTTGSITGLDQTDIYFPTTENTKTNWPIVIMLQGWLVDKANYSKFASAVASYGFIVAVPNHERKMVTPEGSTTGMMIDVNLVNDIFNFIEKENQNKDSPLYQRVDTDKLGLLGHSMGGYVGIATIQELCIPLLCTDSFTKPQALKAGIFYGTSFKDPTTNTFLPINNQNIPIGLIAGDKDGVAMGASSQLVNSQATYEQIQNPHKILAIVSGANHYSITNEDNLAQEKNRPTLSQDVAIETIARWSALFLKAHLLNDQSATDYIYNTGDQQDDNVSVIHGKQ
jgi:predicted dienelactone hydrolase